AGTKEEPLAAELINPLALRQREEIREKLAAAKEKRLLNQKLGKVKTLGEEEPWLDDAAAWIERSRALQREKELAEKRVGRDPKTPGDPKNSGNTKIQKSQKKNPKPQGIPK
ncbi:U4/U6.U5 tri-snRNP-associated protein 1-like, partial [Pyrgilauda ruficollis]|uniref:U4/U6.U5 tri-snRNP-associated protein 1-like n=1 Tax=Pyrgilauda ruficollis TaxID=221976 RepID=UPI001B870B42